MRISIITTAAAITVLSSNIAYANHYSGYRWLLPYTNVCYDSYSLSLININGYTNRYSVVASEIDQARNDWNDQPSIFTINKVSGNNCNNWITSGYAPSASWLARVIYNQQGGYLVDTDMEINRGYKFVSYGRCTGQPYTLDYVARHEFGHYVMFNDVWWTNPSSTMYGGYDCNIWNGVKSYDSNELSSIYR